MFQKVTGPSRLGAIALVASVGLLLDTRAEAQQPTTAVQGSRIGEIEAARLAKAQRLTPELPTQGEQKIDEFTERDWIGKMMGAASGFGIKFGGLVSGAGFAVGPSYTRPDLLGERMKFTLSAVGSMKQFYAIDTGLSFPQIAGDRFDVEMLAGHSDAPSLRYYGRGSASQRAGESNYRREDTYGSVRVGWRPDRRHWLMGYRTQILALNVGPGTSTLSPSSETLYSVADAPGIDQQPKYLVSGPVLLADYRDRPNDPHRGTAVEAHFDHYLDRSHSQYSFRMYDVQVEHYIPFFNEKRVIALFARTQLTNTSEGNTVPFYMRPVLGGNSELRGFSQFRFNDNNYLLLSTEYRWEVAPALDVAAFGDAGNVFARPGLIGFRNMEYSGGVGFRFKTRDTVVLRVDFAASREGFRVWFATSNIFSH
jgi:outer membrane protein assembly factor BamA